MPTPRVTIDALPEQATVEDANLIVVQDADTTKKMTLATLKTMPSAALDAHLADTGDAHDASAISAATSGAGVDSTTVQGQLGQLATLTGSSTSGLADHLADTTAHTAAAISAVPTVTAVGIDVQSQLDQLSTAIAFSEVIEYADDAETIAGTEVGKAVTPAGLEAANTAIDPRKYGLATTATAAVNRAALQAAIDEACGTGDPLTTVRVANRPVVIPAGTFSIDAPINIRSVQHLVVEGAGRCEIRATANMTSMFDIAGMAYSRFGGFTIRGSAGVQVDQAIYLYWDTAVAYRSVTNNSFHDLTIFDLDFVAAIRVGKLTAGNQVDNDEWRNIVIDGGWTAGNVTRWQDGLHLGDAVYANNLLHHVYKANITHVRYGINLDSTQVAVYGAGFGSNEIDLYVATVGYAHFSGIRSELSQRLLRFQGVGAIASQVSLHDVVWQTNSIAADGQVIYFAFCGTLNISQLVLNSISTVQPKVIVGSGAGPVKAIVNGMAVGGSGRAGDTPASTFQVTAGCTATVRGFMRISAAGAITSVEDWESGGTTPTLTLGNNAVAGNSTLTLNAPTANQNLITFNKGGTAAWTIYDAGATGLFFHDQVNGVMHLELSPGTAALGQVRIGCQLRLLGSRGVENGSGGPQWRAGTGSPEGVIFAVPGSLYSRSDGAAGTSLYVKESSGSLATGWVAK